MSIAVSAVIVPSRVLRWAMRCYGVASLGAGVALAAGAAPSTVSRWVLALACALGGIAVLWAPAPGRNVRQIDISGLGQLRLTVQQGMGGDGVRGHESVLAATLLDGSTVWPGMLALRLRRDDGAVAALLLLPDSVEAGQFRRLAVALRHLAARRGQATETNKKL